MNLLQTAAVDDLVLRLQRLTPDTPAQWGRMNVAQMVTHCQGPYKVFFGEIKLRRGWIAKLFGPLMKSRFLSDKPWRKSLPTVPQFLAAIDSDFEKEREKLIGYTRKFASAASNIEGFQHPFFGKLSAEEWATMLYNHQNHHLRQFGV